jgi:hypothetical protein
MKIDKKLLFKPEDNAWVRYKAASQFWGGRKKGEKTQ